jgi:hypothetical protein
MSVIVNITETTNDIQVNAVVQTLDVQVDVSDVASDLASANALIAIQAAQEAEASALSASASEVQTGLDAIATAADRVQTGLDVIEAGIIAANSINAVLIQSLGNITGNTEINLNNGTLIKATLTGAVTLSFTGLPDATSEKAFTLRFSGLEEINFPVGTLFANGAAPVPEGTLYDIPCSIDSTGVVIVYGIINDIS